MKKNILLLVVAALTVIGACGVDDNSVNVGPDAFTYHDTSPPTTPGSLVATPESSSSISLTWQASKDDTTVQGYWIYREGVWLKFASGTSTSDTNLSAATTYCYTVSAIDYSSNQSAQSNQACATTLSAN
jgi:chitodextrinase